MHLPSDALLLALFALLLLTMLAWAYFDAPGTGTP